MNKKTFLRWLIFIKDISTKTYPRFRLQSMEVFKDDASERPYVFVSPVGKYQPHKMFLEDLIEQEKLLQKFDFASLCYIFHAYGVLRASENNDIYYLIEVMPFSGKIKIKNVKTLVIEEWDKNKFDSDYMLLDKKSLRIATDFFSNITKQPTGLNTYHDDYDENSRRGTLRLVK